MRRCVLLLSFLPIINIAGFAQQSAARQWNEVQLSAIREDLARPPVQARNLYHTAMAMYDAWAVYDAVATTYLLGKTVGGVSYSFTGVPPVAPAHLDSFRNKAISYAAYRVLVKRYALSPNAAASKTRFDNLMQALGYDINYTAINYPAGNPADLGNYIGEKIIEMGLADGARESTNYNYIDYAPVNAALDMELSGNASMTDPNRWQPLTIVTAFDQNGNPVPSLQKFICPEWGRVVPFAMPAASAVHYTRNGTDYPVYHDPGTPPLLDTTNAANPSSQDFKWGHAMVAAWSAHLDPADPTIWDISPKAMGNVSSYPATIAGQRSFYNYNNGGDPGTGYTANPVTGMPYTPQLVKRGDFTRVVSQYWADGPSSETPPGHWFALLNHVSDHPGFVKKYEGTGLVLSNMEWDVKTYFTLGGAVHDAAIACWGIKGWYDSPRPVSAIRKMAAYGQSSDAGQPHYHPAGLPLNPGYVELVMAGDPLAGVGGVNVNKIKIKAWKGYDAIADPYNDVAGVGWILADNWLPYQRKTFVTPPFAGYVSGHSTYSRAGAQTLTMLTGSAYFPGGLGEHIITAGSNFLGFEGGPSTDIRLQWASYKDASDQASLSRIWGGIHPPFDDMPGRLIGEQVGTAAHSKAKSYFLGSVVPVGLMYFTAAENNCKVQLRWATSSEQQAKKFILMRSEDGIQYNTKLAEIAAAGNSSTLRNYSFIDAAPNAANFYKLLQVDADGSINQLPIVYATIKKCAGQQDKAVTIFPNPAASYVNIVAGGSLLNKAATISIIAMDGKLLLQKRINALSQTETINVAPLSSGKYMLRIVTAATVINKAVEVIR
jgi:Secretion system C-terminal sorting domain